ncbi:uncharacterized protein LOC134193878 isoform X2 [Corticium candelabrum]|uniref:uncharacterized protein LOC134193878 isoform X2 n=1 Tax=Corticium candelabrum TaxID=121492 RepID=UPI002E25D33C|nr:uncharacterized protein LOC134193878 isoform X2 [Corticium candelabrum]
MSGTKENMECERKPKEEGESASRLVTHCSRLYGGQSDLSQNDPSSLAKSSDINEEGAASSAVQPLLPLEPNDIWPMSQDDLTNIFVQEKRKISEIVGLAFEHELTQHHHTSSPPFPRQISCGFFCGREGELKSLLRYFTVDLKEGRPRIKVIVGFGGLGKTSLSFRYADCYRERYPGGVFYFDLGSLSTFHNSVKDNLVVLGHTVLKLESLSQNFERLQKLLRHGGKKCLFLYDGADKLLVFNDYIPSIAIDVIITTRMANISHHQLRGNSTVSLKVLGVSTSVEILISGMSGSSGERLTVDEFQRNNPEDFCYAQKIAGDGCLDGLPLALLHAANLRRSQGLSFKDLWERLQDKSIIQLDPANVKEWLRNYNLKQIDAKLALLHLESLDDLRRLTPQGLDNSDLTVDEKKEILKAREELVRAPAYITWRLDIESACLESSLASDLLRLSALLPSNDIPEDILVKGVILKNKGSTETEVRRALACILSHSLLTSGESYISSVNHAGRTFAMHPMIQYSVSKHLFQSQEQHTSLMCLGAVLCKILPSATDFQKELHLTDGTVAQYAKHLFHVALYICNSSELLKKRWLCRTVALASILAIRQYDTHIAVSLCSRQLFDARKRRVSKQKLADALVQTGSCHSILLEAEAAITLFKEALDILGDRPHNKQLAFAEKWGQALFEIIRGCRLFSAFDMIKSTAKRLRSGLEWAEATNCQSYAQSLNSIAVALRIRATASNAEEIDHLSQLALTVYRKCLPEKHPNIATELTNSAHAYCDQGMYSKAENFANRALEMQKKCLPPNHHHIAYSWWFLGTNYMHWGRHDAAEIYLTKALDCVNSYSVVTYTTLYTFQSVAEWYAMGKKTDLAINYLGKAKDVMQQVIGDHDKHAKAKALYRCGRCWMLLHEVQKAEQFLKETLDLLEDEPKDNYIIMQAKGLLCQCLVVQRRFSEAESLLTNLLKVQDSFKSQFCPQRGENLHCLGVCLLALNNPGDAETSFRKAVDIREQYLVANDKRTGESYHQLAICLKLLGKHDEAKQFVSRSLHIERLHSNGGLVNYNASGVLAKTKSMLLNALAMIYWQKFLLFVIIFTIATSLYFV